MPSERRRHNLYEEAKQVFSPESADEFMSYFPPVGWADVATKQDLNLIRSEMDALRAEMRGDMADLRAEMRGDMASLRTELAKGYVGLQRWTVTTMIGIAGFVLAIVLAVDRIGG
jgi:hypothetical protein